MAPTRGTPPLCPQNEVGVPKVVCTTVRPSQPHARLGSLRACVTFVAESCAYEPLQGGAVLPEHLACGASTLQWQARAMR